MSSYNEKYYVGEVALAEPYFDYYHTLPLVAFSDVKGGLELNLVYNSNIKSENHFNLGNGFKFNLQKKLIINGTAITLLDGNGQKITCNPATNEVGQATISAYALRDNSHRVLRKTSTGYELEYPDYSKELFDTTGKIVGTYDKYGEKLLEFCYNGNLLSSIEHRLNASPKKVFEISYDSSNRPHSVLYKVDDATVLCACDIYYYDNALIVSHYSNVDYHYEISGNVVTIYSAERGYDYVNEYSHQIVCNKSNSTNINVKYYDSETKSDEMHYYASALDGNNEIRFLEITDRYGVKNQVQYQNHLPCFSYEIKATESDMFATDGRYIGNVTINEMDGVNGVISPLVGSPMKRNVGSTYSWTGQFASNAQTSDYVGNLAFCGWIKSTMPFTVTLSCGAEKHDVKIEVANKWQYFAFPFNNGSRYVEITCNANPSYLQTKDTRLVLMDKYFTGAYMGMKKINDAQTIRFNEVKFASSTNGLTANTRYSATESDIFKYCLNHKKNHHTNEFYYNDGRNLITNMDTAMVCWEPGTYDNMLIPTPVLDYEFYTEYKTQDSIKYETKTFGTANNEFLKVRKWTANTDNEFHSFYDQKLDLVCSKEVSMVNGQEQDVTIETYTRESNGFVTHHSIGTDIVRTYVYDQDVTALVSETDEFGAVIYYETDPIWGNVTKVTVKNGSSSTAPIVAETTTAYSDDGTELSSCTFGHSGQTSQNSISYCNVGVEKFESGNLNYVFDYQESDLRVIKKNNVNIKNITTSNNDKTVTVDSPTSSTASYVKKATTDIYGRTTGIYKTTTATTPDVLKNEYKAYEVKDEDGNVTSTYDCSAGQLVKSTDMLTEEVTKIAYSGSQKVKVEIYTETNQKPHIQEYEYDKNGRLSTTEFRYKNDGNDNYDIVAISEFEYATGENKWDTDNRTSIFDYDVNGYDVVQTFNEYDGYKRLTRKTTSHKNNNYRKDLSYSKTRLSNVKDYVTKSGTTTNVSNITYGYDELGRIKSEIDLVSEKTKSYVYDNVGRLIRENNQALGKTYIYEYDTLGNITSKKAYNYTLNTVSGTPQTVAYTYGDTTHPDRLTNFNGTAISYNQQGCPTSIGAQIIGWNQGKLASISTGNPLSGQITTTFTYNAYGQRIRKTQSSTALTSSASTTTHYYYDDLGRLVGEDIESTSQGIPQPVIKKIYIFDGATTIGMVYNNNEYYFQRNIQGDVVGVYNSAGTKVVTFTYDAFGKCSISGDINLALACNIRYRGYYYDAETGFYWVQTRYYSPDWCRWISPDNVSYLDPESANGLNLYLYCGNDPVNYYDPSGKSLIAILALIGATAGFGYSVYKDYQDDGDVFNGSVEWTEYLGSTVLGGVIGGGVGALISNIAPYISAFATRTFTIGGGLSLSAGGTVAVAAGVTITGAEILSIVSIVLGSSILFSIIGKSGGYIVKKYTDDHDPAHVHIYGDDIIDKKHGIRIGTDGKPLSKTDRLPHGAKKALKKLWNEILQALLQ